ncbi:MAG: hypothetical protein KF681_10300 [Bdellovibrionaceae bacterium]|nr:hypothetical protein [Pseudobdellovibrionaceae bacterium]
MAEARLRELIREPWSSYEEAKSRSETIDALLGVQIERAEVSAREASISKADWSHLSAQAFQTPYPELHQILQHFAGDPPLRWVDFGCAYGRMGLIVDWFRPEDRWRGFEYVEARVAEGNRVLRSWCSEHPRIEKVDLNQNFEIPEFDVGFLFDFGSVSEISAFLRRLREQVASKPISMIGRGRATRHLIATEHAWLSQVEEPYHTEHWSLYRSSTDSRGGRV